MLALADYLVSRLARKSGEPLNRQLYRALRDAMQGGLLAYRQPLPASRELAAALGLGRNTVLHAYEQLVAEGFLLSRAGAGTFVAYVADARPNGRPQSGGQVQPAGMSRRGERLLANLGKGLRHPGPAFTPGRPDLDSFPWPLWQKLLQKRQRAATPEDGDYLRGGGHPLLKQALAEYLQLSRGVRCTPGQIIITGGMQQTLDLIGRTLADTGDCAWVEEPGYAGVHAAWRANELDMLPVPVDGEGMRWQGHTLVAPKLIYVTPSHQYPLGAVMSLNRRMALLAEASRHGAWVVEDDYDSEFRHQGQPLSAMQGLDGEGRVLYLGTFSKVMFPALRLGYLVAPEGLVAPLTRLQTRLWRESDHVTQAAVADFIIEGHFAAHIRRMRGIYARRQAKLRATLAQWLGLKDDNADNNRGLDLLGGAAGMHVVLRLPAGSDDKAISTALVGHALDAPPLSGYCLGSPPFPGLLLGYAGLDDAALTLAAVRLAKALRGMGVVPGFSAAD